MFKLLIILMVTMLIAGCGSGGGSGLGSSSGLDSGSTGSSGGIGGELISGFSGPHTPEPTTLALLGLGAAGLAIVLLRRKKD